MKRKTETAGKFLYIVWGLLLICIFPVLSILVFQFYKQDIYIFLMIICALSLFWGLSVIFSGMRRKRLIIRYQELEKQTEERANEIRGLMDVSGLGFLSFTTDLTVNPEYSRECEQIFKEPISGKYIHELLFINPSIRDEFKEGLELFFAGKSKAQVIFNLTEKETVIQGKFYKLDFREINEQNILCVLTDTTSERRLEEKIEHEEEERKILLRAVSYKSYFGSFIKEAEMVFDTINLLETQQKKSRKELEDFQRKLHTFKGNAGFFGFTTTEEVAYDFEYYIADMIELEGEIEFSEITQDLKRAYYSELQIIKKTLGAQWLEETNSVLIQKDEYLKIEKYIKEHLVNDKVFCEQIERYRKVPIKNLFARFPAMAEKLAEGLGKKIAPLQVTGGEYLVLPEKYESVINSFVHLIRNMVDHGIETVTEREIQHKSKAGEIKIDIQVLARELVFRFSDDGAGISLNKIKQKAIDMGLLQGDKEITEKALLDLLFVQSFSTAETVSQVSGWGVGLAAVKEMVDYYKGRINIITKLNAGTTFEIFLPVI